MSDAGRDRCFAAWSHLSGVLAFVGPAVMYWYGRRRNAILARESREAMFAQLHFASVTACLLTLGAIFASSALGRGCMLLGALVHAASFVSAITGGVRAARTGTYRYPLLGESEC